MSRVVVQAEVDIKRSPEEVFDYASDPIREPEWNPMMKHIVKLTEGPVAVGARYRTERAQGPAMVIECIGYDRRREWSFEGIHARSRQRAGAMSCHLRGFPSCGWSSGRTVFSDATPLLRRRMTSMFQQAVDNIRTRLEAVEGATPGKYARQ